MLTIAFAILYSVHALWVSVFGTFYSVVFY